MNADFTFDEDNAIATLGLQNSSNEVKQAVIGQLKATLDQRMGLRMQEELDQAKMQTFLELADKSEAEAREWLQQQVPNYHQIYQEELDRLLDRLRRNADVMVDAAKKTTE